MSAAFIAGALILGIGLTEARADVSAPAEALRRIVGRSSYIIELTQSTGAGAPRRIGKLYIFARGAPGAMVWRRGPNGSAPIIIGGQS